MISFELREQLGWSYGTWCAAWDDGICTQEANGADWAPLHSCSTVRFGGCELSLPDLDWSKPQLQCCDAWCYVNPETCNATHWGITIEHSIFTDEDLYFSYGVCPDWNSRSNYPPDGGLDFSQYHRDDCPYQPWPIGCNCVGDNTLLGEDNVNRLGQDYGEWCAAWEDGLCTPDATPADAPLHTCNSSEYGTLYGCEEMWAINKLSDQSWCCDSWCYVNKSCDRFKHQVSVKNSWVNPALKYSYGVCSDDYSKPTPTLGGRSGWLADFSQYKAAECPYKPTIDGCECLGDNSALGEEILALHGEDYGKWCAAWEDGKCTPSIPDEVHPTNLHTCGGSLGPRCEDHWPTGWDFNEPQLWCCQAWCYIDINTCTPEKQEFHGINVAKSWMAEDVYYSWDVCPDSFSGPKIPYRRIPDFAQYDEETCPYRTGIDWDVPEPEPVDPITQPTVENTVESQTIRVPATTSTASLALHPPAWGLLAAAFATAVWLQTDFVRMTTELRIYVWDSSSVRAHDQSQTRRHRVAEQPECRSDCERESLRGCGGTELGIAGRAVLVRTRNHHETRMTSIIVATHQPGVCSQLRLPSQCGGEPDFVSMTTVQVRAVWLVPTTRQTRRHRVPEQPECRSDCERERLRDCGARNLELPARAVLVRTRDHHETRMRSIIVSQFRFQLRLSAGLDSGTMTPS
eukprot:CAMPEP_0196757772 /NCGR_PEP_ID=MMETSP1091-20130531/103838_1 /TAXON_ID=302021 /ORGANISM="Rhodomonas sp., Strain CCMP768" /LENGTH=684 /DNA_ID=CAMNT_0042106557 /DNA_START=104 /DNA_END=2156 /DNA_ORIENTATION=+